MQNEQIEEIFKRFEVHNTNPAIELEYKNAFTLLVAIVLSAQTTDKKVNAVTKNLFNLASNPKDMVELGLNNLKDHIRTIGLFNSKAQNIIKLSEKLIAKKKGEVPKDFLELTELPGVGRKSANVFLNAYHSESRIGVDTHVFRISKRIGLSHGKNVLEIEKDLEAIIPQQYMNRASMWLVLHGRYVCKAKKPLCSECLLSDLCEKNIE